MSTNPPTPDPNGLPLAPTRGSPVSAAMFDRLMEAASKGGWAAVYTTFAQGETTTEAKPYAVYERPARRRTLAAFLDKRPDLRALLDNAAQERRDRLLSALEDEVERIALGPGDVTQDFDAKTGALTRTRVDRRNKLHALLKLLGSHDPDTYADRKRLDVAGQVNHAHAHLTVNAPSGYVINVEALEALEPEERTTLMRLIVKMEESRREPPALPPGGQA
ncbi:MAG: hypothetical protein KF757_06845 [Phycisphaeraceae bacterium]|nr:hypothetical protein [Phycisphaeraceae bacterium]